MVMSGEPIFSQEPFIMIIRFQMSLILPKLIVWRDSGGTRVTEDGQDPPNGKHKQDQEI